MTRTTAAHVICSDCADTTAEADTLLAAITAAEEIGWIVGANDATCPSCISRGASAEAPNLPPA